MSFLSLSHPYTRFNYKSSELLLQTALLFDVQLLANPRLFAALSLLAAKSLGQPSITFLATLVTLFLSTGSHHIDCLSCVLWEVIWVPKELMLFGSFVTKQLKLFGGI